MLSNLFSPLFAKILVGVSAVLLVAVAVQAYRANHYRDKAEACAARREADRIAYAAAAKEAGAKAMAAKLATEARYRAEAERIDDDYQTALARAQRASAAYVARMRAEVARGASGGAPAPRQGDGPESPDRSGPNAELVAVGREDFDILVENSVRLEAAHQWAKTLDVGALPDPEFGQPES